MESNHIYSYTVLDLIERVVEWQLNKMDIFDLENFYRDEMIGYYTSIKNARAFNEAYKAYRDHVSE